jgi:hypothetical protein
MSSESKELDAGRAAVVAGLLIACHLALCAYFAPRAELQSGRLVLNDAFAIEAYRAFRALAALETWGMSSAYDPSMLGGQPSGLVELFGTRVFVASLAVSSRLGIDPARAFNATIVVLHAMVPLVAYGAARAFRLGRGTALVVMGFWVFLWFFDSLTHYAWFSGRIAWGSSSGMAVLLLGAGSRIAGGQEPKWALAVVAVGLVSFFFHPVPSLVASVILIGVALGRGGLLPWRRALLAGAALVPVLALAAGGRAAALSSEPVARIFEVGVGQVVSDVLELSSSGYRAPGATRTMVRVLVLVAGALGLKRLRASSDYRYAPLALGAVVGTGVAYCGDYLPVRWPIDPYFFALFGAFAATIPAAFLLSEIDWREVLRSRAPRTVVIVVAVVATPRLFRTAATYIPELLPSRVVRSTIDYLVSPFVGVKEPLPDRLRHEASPPSFGVVAAWFAEHHGGRGSILCDDAALTAYLSATGALPILGPIAERGSPSEGADPTRLFSEPASPADVAAFLDQHAVGWVALWGAPSRFDLEDPLLDPVVRVAGVRIRRLVKEPSFFVVGDGRIRGMSLGRLRVTTASNDEGVPAVQRITLRFHYDRSLECRPNCRVTPAPYADAYGAGQFITVEKPPPEFELGH